MEEEGARAGEVEWPGVRETGPSQRLTPCGAEPSGWGLPVMPQVPQPPPCSHPQPLSPRPASHTGRPGPCFAHALSVHQTHPLSQSCPQLPLSPPCLTPSSRPPFLTCSTCSWLPGARRPGAGPEVTRRVVQHAGVVHASPRPPRRLAPLRPPCDGQGFVMESEPRAVSALLAVQCLGLGFSEAS